jgi:hypothetical protein
MPATVAEMWAGKGMMIGLSFVVVANIESKGIGSRAWEDGALNRENELVNFVPVLRLHLPIDAQDYLALLF